MSTPNNSRRDPHADPLIASVMRTAGAVTAQSCPEAELLALYAEHELSSDERGPVETHVAGCGRCQATLAAFVRSAPEPGVPEATSGIAAPSWWAGWRWMVPLASATAVAAVAVWIGRAPEGEVAEQNQMASSAPSDAAREPLAKAEERDVLETSAQARVVPAPPAAHPPQAAATAASPVASEATTQSPADATREVARANELAPYGPGQAAMADRLESRARTAPEARALSRERQEAAAPSAPAPPPPAMARRSARAADEPSPRADGGRAAPRAAGVVIDATTSGTANALGMTASKAVQPPVWRVRDGGVERSPDQGQSWQRAAVPAGVRIEVVAAPPDGSCWAIGASAVLRTADGATWTRTTSPTSDRLVAVSATDARHAEVTTAAGERFATSDGGAAWRRLP